MNNHTDGVRDGIALCIDLVEEFTPKKTSGETGGDYHARKKAAADVQVEIITRLYQLLECVIH